MTFFSKQNSELLGLHGCRWPMGSSQVFRSLGPTNSLTWNWGAENPTVSKCSFFVDIWTRGHVWKRNTRTWENLREPQHTPGAYPEWKEFLHKLLVGGLGYAPATCWKILIEKQTRFFVFKLWVSVSLRFTPPVPVTIRITLPETNIAPETGWLED